MSTQGSGTLTWPLTGGRGAPACPTHGMFIGLLPGSMAGGVGVRGVSGTLVAGTLVCGTVVCGTVVCGTVVCGVVGGGAVVGTVVAGIPGRFGVPGSGT